MTVKAARHRNTKPVTSRRIGRGGADGGALAERVLCLERELLVDFAVFCFALLLFFVLFFDLLVDLLFDLLDLLVDLFCAMNRVLSLF